MTRETSPSAPRPMTPSGPRPGGFRPRPGSRPGGRTRYVARRKVCFFCANKNEVIDYKNPDKLRTFMSERAKMEPRRRTGTCAKHQRALSTAIKRARHLALLPFVPEHIFPSAQLPTLQPSFQPAAQSTPQPAAQAAPPLVPPPAPPPAAASPNPTTS